MLEVMAAACAGYVVIFSIARCLAPMSSGRGSRCGSVETGSPNCFTIACRMAAAQFFSVCLRCEADQHAGQVGKALSRGRMRYRTASNSRCVGASLSRLPTTPLLRFLVQVPCAQILKVLFQCHQIQPARKSEASRADHEPDIRIPFFGKHRRTNLVLVPIFDDVCLLFDVV